MLIRAATASSTPPPDSSRPVRDLGAVTGTPPAPGGTPSPGVNGRVHAAAQDQGDPGADGPPGLPERVQAARLLGDEGARWPAHAVPDGDLAGVHRVEPGKGLIDADVLRPQRP